MGAERDGTRTAIRCEGDELMFSALAAFYVGNTLIMIIHHACCCYANSTLLCLTSILYVLIGAQFGRSSDFTHSRKFLMRDLGWTAQPFGFRFCDLDGLCRHFVSAHESSEYALSGFSVGITVLMAFDNVIAARMSIEHPQDRAVGVVVAVHLG